MDHGHRGRGALDSISRLWRLFESHSGGRFLSSFDAMEFSPKKLKSPLGALADLYAAWNPPVFGLVSESALKSIKHFPSFSPRTRFCASGNLASRWPLNEPVTKRWYTYSKSLYEKRWAFFGPILPRKKME